MSNMFDVIKFKKFFEKKKQWYKGPKIDETSLNVEVHAKNFSYQFFF